MTLIRNVLLLVAMLVLPSFTWGADYICRTTSASFTNWTTAATWKNCNNTYPHDRGDGNRYRAEIHNGHNVIIPAGKAIQVGYSTSTGRAANIAFRNVSTSGTGILTVNGTLRFNGHVQQANATWTANAGARLEHAGVGYSYGWQIGMVNNQANSKLVLLGTSDNSRVVVTNATNASRFDGFHQGSTTRNATPSPTGGTAITGSARFDATFALLQHLGATNDWLTASATTSSGLVKLTDTIVDDCSMLTVAGIAHVDAYIQIIRSTFLNPYGNFSLLTKQALNYSVTQPQPGHFQILDSVIGGISLQYGTGWEVERNVIYSKYNPSSATLGVPLVNTTGVHFSTFDDNLVWNNSPTGWVQMPQGNVYRMVSVNTAGTDQFRKNVNNTSASNNPVIAATSWSTHIHGAVIENGNASPSGGNTAFIFYDQVAGEWGTSSEYNIVENVIEIPHYSTKYSMMLQGLTTTERTSTENVNFHLTVHNNTKPGGFSVTAPSFISDIEGTTGVGFTGLFPGTYNNLIWGAPGTNYGVVVKQASPPQENPVPSIWINANYNMTWNISNSDLYMPGDTFFDTPPGANDYRVSGPTYTANSLFKNPDFNMLVWAKSINPAITDYAGVLAELLKKNTSAFNPLFDHMSYYVLAVDAFTPKPAIMATSGYQGSYIGAVPDDRPPNVSIQSVVTTEGQKQVSFVSSATDVSDTLAYSIEGSDTPCGANTPNQNWATNPPTSYSGFTTFGTKYLCVWAKDGWGNIGVAQTSFTLTDNPVDGTNPVVGTFTIPATSTSLTVQISALSATDNVAVTGYAINESSTPPALDAFAATAPTSYTFGGGGSRTAYAWAVDAKGNRGYKTASIEITLADSTAPVVTGFTMPTDYGSLSVPVSTLTATDATGVTGYMITTSNSQPTSSDSRWTATVPATATGVLGANTFYAWAKDAAGNVSSASANSSATVNITATDTTRPVITAFTMPETATSLTVSVSSLEASDDSGTISGYAITTSSQAPSASATGVWSSQKPTTAKAGSAGSVTFYAWAKDPTDNVSLSSSAVVTITLADTTAPVITDFSASPLTGDLLTGHSIVIKGTDGTGVTGYLLSDTLTAANKDTAGWKSVTSATDFTTTVTDFVFTGRGDRSLYVWLRDAADNISDPQKRVINITPLATTVNLDELAQKILYTQLSEDYAVQGQPITLAQALYMLVQLLSDKTVVGTTMKVKGIGKNTTLDNPAMILRLNNANNPSSITREK